MQFVFHLLISNEKSQETILFKVIKSCGQVLLKFYNTSWFSKLHILSSAKKPDQKAFSLWSGFIIKTLDILSLLLESQ